MANTNPYEDDTTITYFDRDGRVLPDASGATEALIKEHVRGVEVRRTYATVNERPQWRPAGEVRGEPDAVDSVKNTWDVFASENGLLHLANTLPDLLQAMEWDALPEDEQRVRVANLRRLPSWKAAPESLRTQVDAWLSI